MREELIADMMAYVRSHVKDYDFRLDFALDIVGDYRCPLFMADGNLVNDMKSAAKEWIENYNTANQTDPVSLEDLDEWEWDELISVGLD